MYIKYLNTEQPHKTNMQPRKQAEPTKMLKWWAKINFSFSKKIIRVRYVHLDAYVNLISYADTRAHVN